MKIKTNYPVYIVGGFVRDKLLGIESKDVDLAVEAPSYDALRSFVIGRGCEIYLEQPQHFTIRAKCPVHGDVDYVLCRKDGDYSDGRRPDSVDIGTIDDDLARRDFTMNALALTESGNLIDPHGGAEDIKRKLIRCVGNPRDRLSEDSLRLLRAIRFSVTKGFSINGDVKACLDQGYFIDRLTNVSVERVREELYKAFKHDTFKTILTLTCYGRLCSALFNRGHIRPLWLEPTLKNPHGNRNAPEPCL